jgi:hypothetical protein
MVLFPAYCFGISIITVMTTSITMMTISQHIVARLAGGITHNNFESVFLNTGQAPGNNEKFNQVK